MHHRIPLLIYSSKPFEGNKEWSAAIPWPAQYQQFQDPRFWQVIQTDGKAITIEQVRQLQQDLAYHSAQPRTLILEGIDTASAPAQQALLKVLEEPPEHTCLILTARSALRVPSTIRSRCWEISLKSEPSSTNMNPGQLPSTAQAWWELIRGLSDRAVAVEWVEEQLRQLHSNLATNSSLPVLSQLQQFLVAKRQLQQNANVKLALEHLALTSLKMNKQGLAVGGQTSLKTVH